MSHAVLWGNGGVIGGVLLDHGRKKGKNTLHGRGAATKAKKTARENSGTGLHDESSGGEIFGVAHEAPAGNINEQMMTAKEVRTEDRLLHVRQKELVHNTESRER